MVICSFRCLKKVFKKEGNKNTEGNSRGVTTSSLPYQEDRKVKDRNDEILG